MSSDLVPSSSYTLSPAEYALLEGDLSRLSEGDRLNLYNAVCLSLGLNPMTAPFGYIKLSGKLTLYAKKDCTDQLRRIHGVSITDLIGKDIPGAYIVTAKAQDKSGRTDIATGVLSLDGLKGEALCNALMKAETKSKRRVTLSICGLGMLDESETSSIPGAEIVPHSPIVTAQAEERKETREEDPITTRRNRALNTFKDHFDTEKLTLCLPPESILDVHGKPVGVDGTIHRGRTFSVMSEQDLEAVEVFMSRPDAPVKEKPKPTESESKATMEAMSR